MRKTSLSILILMGIFLLSGCGPKWVSIDGFDTSSAKLESARDACQVGKKLYDLSYDRLTRDAALNVFEDEAARQSVKDIYTAKEKQVHSEIDACMEKHGLVKKQ